MAKRTTEDEDKTGIGPAKGDFIPPPDVEEQDERADALPPQEEFWRPPTRFGSVPVEKEPLGWDRRKGFRKLFPPFFSGRNYNVIFGDQNELRSFSDIWEGGMPGYLIWLNTRLYEMKRLLKKTGSIYVHCDWHASHYIKIEMDRLFGYKNFINEVVWCYEDVGGKATDYYKRKHDVLLLYQRSDHRTFVVQRKGLSESTIKRYSPYFDKNGQITYRSLKESNPGVFRKLKGIPDDLDRVWLDVHEGAPLDDWWSDISTIKRGFDESIGYPTQKPEGLIERVVRASCPDNGVVADFFIGGGTTAAVAQRLGRRWIACDQSRVAVAITADRLTRQVEEQTGKLFPVPDFTVEHWGVYEARRLADAPADQFRAFVLRAFGAVTEEHEAGIHGYKGAIPVWVGEADQKKAVTAADVQAFANARRKTLRYKQDNLRDGIMLAWAFRPDAVEAADRLRRLEQTDLNFIRLDMIRIDSPRFREHVTALSTDNADYQNFLTFVQPPRVEVGYKRISTRTFKFDVSETAILNAGAKIINVQWDFDYGKRFSSTPGYSFVRGKNKEVALQAQYEFPVGGKKRIACKVQDDMGGEGLWTAEIEVS